MQRVFSLAAIVPLLILNTGHMADAAGDPMRVDKVERHAFYLSLLAAAQDNERNGRGIPSIACLGLTGPARNSDADNDGVDDAFDAVPDNADEFAKDNNGDGSYEICSIEQLQAIVTLGQGEGNSTLLTTGQRLRRNYQLAADLDAASIENFVPIGNCGTDGECAVESSRDGYSGVFDGRNRTIRNLTIDQPALGGVGLIGALAESGVILNLNLENANVKGRSRTGIVVGANTGTIFKVRAAGKVEADEAAGGLAGSNSGLIVDSAATGTVMARQMAGGLVGDMTGAVFDSAAAVDVGGSRGLGGLAGVSTFGTIIGGQASGTVKGEGDLGGLVGVNTDATVSNSFSTSSVTGTAVHVGGLIGDNALGLVRNSYATGPVQGGNGVGALTGRNNGIIRRSYALGEVTAETNGGGLIGERVGGEDRDSFTDSAQLTPSKTGWSPDRLPVNDFLDYFCDLNRNGYIDPDERVRTNFVWIFTRRAPPSLRCNPAKS
ncbi:MAG: hypothetical protein KDE14_09425 [Rhodobacteraceae bacterium]|nr:hypothetical protein [Paracoccaceae bacterium]